MKIKSPTKCWATIQQTITISLPIFVFFILQFLNLSSTIHCAIIPPPWSDPNKNPCASLPGGWQLLYWAPLKKCFKIFQIGYPCPDTMELSPIPPGKWNKLKTDHRNNNNIMTAECKCPPGTAQSAITNKCHQLFEQGPCQKGQYFSPLIDIPTLRSTNRWGTCRSAKKCAQGMVSWPKDEKCYTTFTRGPCPKGKLIVMGENGIGKCKCENSGDMQEYFHHIDETCHEHYTRGPCQINGQIFLPGGNCGCSSQLPHYHEFTNQCYELGTPGPCPPGHLFIIPDDISIKNKYAVCQCKEGYIRWTDGICYRLYTRGPCEHDEFLINSTTCIKNFCGKGRLYFPQQQTCYRIGSQGPCALFQVVVFDFTSRPSIDGISYKGMCGCSGIITSLDQKCSDSGNSLSENTCESTPGMVELEGNCYKLYSRGPCGPGQWLEPYKDLNNSNSNENNIKLTKAKCRCRPGYKTYDDLDTRKFHQNEENNEQQRPYWMNNSCYPPSVGIARYLNNQRQHRNDNNKFDYTNFMSGSSLILNTTEDKY